MIQLQCWTSVWVAVFEKEFRQDIAFQDTGEKFREGVAKCLIYYALGGRIAGVHSSHPALESIPNGGLEVEGKV